VENALNKPKVYLKKIPTMLPPKSKEELLLYVTSIDAVVSTILSVDRPIGQGEAMQLSVYFVSEIQKNAHT
jgi:hypothetical protein